MGRAEGANYRDGFLGAASGSTLTTAQTEFNSISSNQLAGYVPQVYVIDPTSTSSTGGAILVDPVGHISGLAARMDREGVSSLSSIVGRRAAELAR